MIIDSNQFLFKKDLIHFTGIGGIGMSGIAEILHNLGCLVQGSDISNNSNVERLISLGINVFVGQTEANVKNAKVVVRSSAVKDENPEIKEARKRRIPVISRAEMLAEIMRLKLSVAVAGTHGKTTTTSIIARCFDEAGLNPTVINGGIINSHKTNAYLGSGDWLIAEADESDGSFLKLPHNIAIVTNIDREHMEHYHTYDNLKDAFISFINQVPFYGFAVLCVDHPVVEEIADKILDRKIIRYTINAGKSANIKAVNINRKDKGYSFDVEIYENIIDEKPRRIINDMYLPMFGIHNVQNSLSAIAICDQFSFSDQIIKDALAKFMGVKRRLTITGVVGGITIIDDYAHHPKEIEATLKAIKDMRQPDSKVIAIFQPHRYSRTSDLLDEFASAFSDSDYLMILDIYSAGETPIDNINKERLESEVRKKGHKNVFALKEEELAEKVSNIVKQNDIVVFLGAGSITKIANHFPVVLSQLNGWSEKL